VTPVAYERFAVEFMMDRAMHEDLRRAQALLGHQVAAGELGKVFGRALQSLIRELEKSRFGVGRSGASPSPAATRSRATGEPASSTHPRYVTKSVRRTVWERDQGQCTYVSESGQRCPATSPLEFDHIEPIAHGGTSTVENLRLRCRTHNQYEAEREFGAAFMDEMRERATPGQP
jgi:5-methylcytosine-specific restriction endonuclease McrA